MVKSMPANQPNMGRSIFLTILNLKFENNCGSVLFENMVKNWHSWCQPVHPQPLAEYVIKIFYFVFQFYAWVVIALKISFFGPRPNRPLPENFLMRHMFLPKWMQIFFGPIRCKAAELLDCLLSTEWQSHRVTTFPLPIWVGEILLCPFLINSPTGFACRGMNGETLTLIGDNVKKLMNDKSYQI